MLSLIFICVLYFLPSIIAHDKQNFAGIFVLNFLLGWTVIGWILALIWACTADVRAPLLAVTGPGLLLPLRRIESAGGALLLVVRFTHLI